MTSTNPRETISMILCGGLGKRLRPLTDSTPKPLIEIRNGYTILDKQILDMKYAGINRVILLTGYLHEKIEDRYGSQWGGVRIEYSVEEDPIGTWGAVATALERFKPRCTILISNGDIVTDLNIRKMIASSRYPTTMFILTMRSPYGIVELSGDKIIGFVEKPQLPYYINGGFYIVDEGLDLLEFIGKPEPPSDLEKDVFPKLARLGLLGYYMEPYDVFWKSIDTVKDLEEIRKEFAYREDKPWGYEKLIESTPSYVYKKILIKEGYRIPLHKHQASETVYVVSGRIKMNIDDREIQLEQGEKYTVEADSQHAVSAIETAIVDSISSPNVGEVCWLDGRWAI
ncbi:MAG: sugar phosphate nucleotidyltransferase [Candidatus Bathyarchaeia archaeon]